MAKVLYGLAFFCLVMGVIDAIEAAAGRRDEIEAAILLLLVPALAGAGFAVSRAPTMKCAHCSKRVRKDASLCSHCGRYPHQYRTLFTPN